MSQPIIHGTIKKINKYDHTFELDNGWKIQHYIKFYPIEVGDMVGISNYSVLAKGMIGIKEAPYTLVGVTAEVMKGLMPEGYRDIRYTRMFEESLKTDIYALHEKADNWREFRNPGIFAEYKEKIPPGVCTVFIENWYKRVMTRQLWLWGFYQYEIKKCYAPVTSIIKQCVLNPLGVAGLSLEKGVKLLLLQGSKITSTTYAAASIFHKLIEYLEQGWTCVPLSVIVNDLPMCCNQATLAELIGDNFKVVHHEASDCFYLPFMYEMENFVIDEIKKRIDHPTEGHQSGFASETKSESQGTAKEESISAPTQPKDLLAHILAKRFIIVDGEAGTGKTTLIKRIFKHHEKMKGRLQGLCFMGKAVARLKEAIGTTAMTIDMAIAKKNQVAPFTAVAIDEWSTVSIILLYRFFKAFPGTYPVYFFGDKMQLPPIEAGRPINDIVVHMEEEEKNKAGAQSTPTEKTQSGTAKQKPLPIDILRLTHNYRIIDQENLADNKLYKALQQIRRGDTKHFDTGDEFKIIPGREPEILGMIKEFHDQQFELGSFVVLTPYNEDVDNINRYAQNLFHGHDTTKRLTDCKGNHWYVGDIVMMKRNNYDHGIFNGSLGRVIETKEAKQFGKEPTITVLFDDDIKVEYLINYNAADYKDRDDDADDEAVGDRKAVHTGMLQLAYALTVHKSQGSQWPLVVFYIGSVPSSGSSHFNRNLIYTGAGRAEAMLRIVGDVDVLAKGVKRELPPIRSNLAMRLCLGG